MRMRTTIRLDPHLLARAKEVAAASGKTLNAVIERAARFGVRWPQPPLSYVEAALVGYKSGDCGRRTPNYLARLPARIFTKLRDRSSSSVSPVASASSSVNAPLLMPRMK